MHRLLYYRLAKIYEQSLTLVTKITGEIDYTTGEAATAQTITPAKAVVMPVKVCSEFFKGLVSHSNRLERSFFFEIDIPFNQDNTHILLDGQRYNIKETINLSSGYWLVMCTAQNGDTHE